MKCVECVHCTSEGMDPKMRRRGVNLCAVKPEPPGYYLTLEYDRQCHEHSPASPDVAAARRAWLDSKD